MPNSDGFAGFVSVRIEYIFYILLLLYLSTFSYSFKIIIPSIIVILISSMAALYHQSVQTKNLNIIAEECLENISFLKENSIVLPINFSDNWQAGHFSNY